jgi:hypothetical protein
MPITSMHKTEIKQLRSDARKLETVAKHLRQQAKALSREAKVNELHKAATTSDGVSQAMIDRVEKALTF